MLAVGFEHNQIPKEWKHEPLFFVFLREQFSCHRENFVEFYWYEQQIIIFINLSTISK